MPVLADGTIQTLVERDDLGIEPFDPSNLTPNGYDLSIAEVMLPDRATDTVREEGTARIPPRERFVISTEETVTLGPRICAQLWLRTTFARQGIMAAFGKVEAGFSGQLTISCFNASREAVEIPVGERFCQIAFEALTVDAEGLYEERSGNYQDQRGITLANDP